MGREENYQKLYAMVEIPVRIRQERIRRKFEEQNEREQKKNRQMTLGLVGTTWIVLAFYEYLLSLNDRFNWSGYLMGCFLVFCIWMFVLYEQGKGNQERLAKELKNEERDLEKLQRWYAGEQPRFGVRTVEIQCPKNNTQLCYYDITADFALIEKKYCSRCDVSSV